MAGTPRTSTSSANSSVYSAVDHDKDWLPSLVAKYGASASTAWLEDRYAVWRSPSHMQSNPRVQGYLSRGKFYFAWGPPICRADPEIRRTVAREFVEWATKEKHRRVVWCIIDTEFADMLGKEFNWSVLSCVREDVLRASRPRPSLSYCRTDSPPSTDPDIKKLDHKEVRHNIRRAERAHIKYDEIRLKGPEFHPPDNAREEIDAGLKRWQEKRQGTQIAAVSLLQQHLRSNRSW